MLYRLFLKFTDSLFLIFSLSITTGLYVGAQYKPFVLAHPNVSVYVLAIIFFLSSIKIDMKKVRESASDKWMLAIVTFLMLIAFPFGVYHIMMYVYPSLALPFLILTAMPVGMTAPLLSELAGGKPSLALVLAVITSLLAPFSIPFVISMTVGAVVEVDTWKMFLDLVKIIFIPFILAQFFKYYFQTLVDDISPVFKPLSTMFLAVLLVFIIAKRQTEIVTSFQNGDFFVYLPALFLLFIALHIVGYSVIFWRHKRDRVTITACLTYMNFTLAVFLASTYFKDSGIDVPVILSIIPWVFMFVPFRYMVKKMGLVS